MTGYFLYFLLVVGLSILLTASFRRLRGDGSGTIPPREDADFERRMAEIEKGVAVKRRDKETSGGKKQSNGENR